MNPRRYHRWEATFPVRIRCRNSVIEGQVSNFSFGGALITSDETLPDAGAPIALQLRPVGAGRRPVISSRIVHSSKRSDRRMELGVQFQEPYESLRGKLLKVFRRLESGQPFTTTAGGRRDFWESRS